jgi:hypothetical protein
MYSLCTSATTREVRFPVFRTRRAADKVAELASQLTITIPAYLCFTSIGIPRTLAPLFETCYGNRDVVPCCHRGFSLVVLCSIDASALFLANAKHCCDCPPTSELTYQALRIIMRRALLVVAASSFLNCETAEAIKSLGGLLVVGE